MLSYYKAHFEAVLALRKAVSEYLYHDDDRRKLAKALEAAERVGDEQS